MSTTPYLHIYAQNFEHDEVWVAGTRDALETLKKALETVLNTNEPTITDDIFVKDGEGYGVVFQILDHADIETLEYPYIHDSARGKSNEASKHPNNFLTNIDIDRLFSKNVGAV
jgi:hypothetical protein